MTTTNLHWLEWAVTKHFRSKGLQVKIGSIKLGNVAIDGEVEGKGWKMALELKTPKDDVTRGIGQLAEALAYGHNQVASSLVIEVDELPDLIICPWLDFEKTRCLLFD